MFVLNIGSRSEVWSGELGSPKGAAQGGYMAQGPIAVAASSAYGMSQPMSAQRGHMPVHQVRRFSDRVIPVLTEHDLCRKL